VPLNTKLCISKGSKENGVYLTTSTMTTNERLIIVNRICACITYILQPNAPLRPSQRNTSVYQVGLGANIMEKANFMNHQLEKRNIH
jgi:hypothetical protein